MKAKIAPVVLTIILSLFWGSCSKSKDRCFDEELYNKHKNDFCTADCPGVIGCDGKTYCNECVARSQGIRVK